MGGRGLCLAILDIKAIIFLTFPIFSFIITTISSKTKRPKVFRKIQKSLFYYWLCLDCSWDKPLFYFLNLSGLFTRCISLISKTTASILHSNKPNIKLRFIFPLSLVELEFFSSEKHLSSTFSSSGLPLNYAWAYCVLPQPVVPLALCLNAYNTIKLSTRLPPIHTEPLSRFVCSSSYFELKGR